MDIRARLAKTVDALAHKVGAVLALAKDERANADTMHESAEREHVNARKLEALGDALAGDAEKLKSEIDKTIEQKLSEDASSGKQTGSQPPVH